MSQGQFTKEEAVHVLDTIDDLFKGLPKNKKLDYLGHLNDICLFLEAAKKAAPAEEKQ